MIWRIHLTRVMTRSEIELSFVKMFFFPIYFAHFLWFRVCPISRSTSFITIKSNLIHISASVREEIADGVQTKGDIASKMCRLEVKSRGFKNIFEACSDMTRQNRNGVFLYDVK